MSMWLMIASFLIIGNLMIPSESAVYEKKADVRRNTVTTSVVKQPSFCSENTPTNCFFKKTPDAEKSDLTVFREHFCFSGEHVSCIKQFYQQCGTNDTSKQFYPILLRKLDEISHDMLELDLCADGPYDPELLYSVRCLRFVRDTCKHDCGYLIEDIEKDENPKISYHFPIFMAYKDCAFKVIGNMCGADTESLIKEHYDAFIKSFTKTI